MTSTTVSPQQRFKRNGLSCPICDGYEQEKRGNGARCYGYLHDGGGFDGLMSECRLYERNGRAGV